MILKQFRVLSWSTALGPWSYTAQSWMTSVAENVSKKNPNTFNNILLINTKYIIITYCLLIWTILYTCWHITHCNALQTMLTRIHNNGMISARVGSFSSWREPSRCPNPVMDNVSVLPFPLQTSTVQIKFLVRPKNSVERLSPNSASRPTNCRHAN